MKDILNWVKLQLGLLKEDEPLTASKAWYESKYGKDTYEDIETRIKNKQEDIKDLIESKFAPVENVAKVISYSSYHCSVDLDIDLVPQSKEIFQPFVDGGFKVINLSQECKAINEDGVFLISWCNGYQAETKGNIV